MSYHTLISLLLLHGCVNTDRDSVLTMNSGTSHSVMEMDTQTETKSKVQPSEGDAHSSSEDSELAEIERKQEAARKQMYIEYEQAEKKVVDFLNTYEQHVEYPFTSDNWTATRARLVQLETFLADLKKLEKSMNRFHAKRRAKTRKGFTPLNFSTKSWWRISKHLAALNYFLYKAYKERENGHAKADYCYELCRSYRTAAEEYQLQMKKAGQTMTTSKELEYISEKLRNAR